MSTQTTAGAREHARSQAGTITDSMPVLPATRWPNPPEDVAPERLTWLRPCRVGGTRPRFSHVEPDCDFATSLAAPAQTSCSIAPTPPGSVSTSPIPSRCHGRPISASGTRCSPIRGGEYLRPWSQTRRVTTTRSAERRHAPPTRRSTGRVRCTVPHPPVVNCSPSLPRRTGSGRRTLRRRCPSSMVSASRRTALSPVRGSAGSGATVDLLIHLPVIVMIANTAHPLDPAPQFPTTSLEVLAWNAADELGGLDDLGPEYQRAVLNTEDAWTASNLEEIA